MSNAGLTLQWSGPLLLYFYPRRLRGVVIEKQS